jgi:hypothetical protein
VGIVAAAVASLGLAACGSSGPGASTTRTTSGRTPTTGGGASSARGAGPLAITPQRPTPDATVRFGYVAPDATGDAHGNRTGYSLSVTGPARRGCVGAREFAGPASRAGARATIAVSTATLGGRWCTGLYTARVLELAEPVCKSGTVCPQFVRVAAIVAHGQFTVTRG